MKKNSKDWILCINCYKLSLKGQENCSFCGHILTEEEIIIDSEIEYEKVGKMGLIFSVISFLIFFISPSFSLTLALMSIVLIVLGTHPLADKYGILISTMTSIMSSMFIIAIVLLSGSQSISYTEIMIKESLGSVVEIENNDNKKYIYDTWLEENGNNLLVLNNNGTFIWYNDKDNLNTNYFSGVFQLKNGATIYNETIYDDGTYYYYLLTLTKFDTKRLTNIAGVTKDKQEEYSFKLRKDAKKSCLENKINNTVKCFVKDTNIEA